MSIKRKKKIFLVSFFLGSFFLAFLFSTSLVRAGENGAYSQINIAKQDWKTDELPSVDLDYAFQPYQETSFFKGLWHRFTLVFKNQRFSVELISPKGNNLKVLKEGKDYKITGSDGKKHVELLNKSALGAPGQYQLNVSVNYDGKDINFSQDFNWGVLVVNANKSIYAPGEKAKLDMAVLDTKGKMVCNARLVLNVKDPSGNTKTLSTDDNSISVNSQACQSTDYTTEPDFYAQYETGGAGNYELELKAESNNGVYVISDSFVVKETVPFDVERTTASRIYPVNAYPVALNITANQDFSGEIKEKVPMSFSVSQREAAEIGDYDKIEEDFANDQKIIIWNVKLKKGDKISIGYQYDAADISPWIFQLGPLEFTRGFLGTGLFQKTVFQEARIWQIASDAIQYQYLPTGGNFTYGSAQINTWRMALMADDVGQTFPYGNTQTSMRSWVGYAGASGLDMNMTVSIGVDLTSPTMAAINKLVINTRWQANSTTLNDLKFQICDYVTAANIDSGTDPQCTGGGWRTLNFNKMALGTGVTNTMFWNQTEKSATAGHGTPYKIGGPSDDSSVAGAGMNSMPAFEVFNGYFVNGTAAISTPLTNFVSGGSVKVRVYSANTTYTNGFAWDYLSVQPVADASAHASSMIKDVGGGETNAYNATFASEGSAPQSHSIVLTAGGLDVRYNFTGINTYNGANAILVDYVGSHANSGVSGNDLYICNFQMASAGDCPAGTSSKWEKLDAASFDPGTTNTAYHFSKYSTSITNYISSGKVMIRLVNGTNSTSYTINTDYIQVTLGSVNDSDSNSEVSLGTLMAGSASTNTQSLDTTGATPAVFAATHIVASTAAQMNSYAYDCVQTAGATPTLCSPTTQYPYVGAAMEVTMPLAQPPGSIITGLRYAGRIKSATNAVMMGIRDWGGTSSVGSPSTVTTVQLPQTNTVGGFVDVGQAASTGTLQYMNGILTDNPQNKVNQVNNTVQMRLHTITSTTAPYNNQWDFAFVSPQWLPQDQTNTRSVYTATAGTAVTGLNKNGGWRKTIMADDISTAGNGTAPTARSWTIGTTAGGGLNANLTVSGISDPGKGTNKMFINTRWYTNSASLTPVIFQVCDWTSTTNVDAVADSECTGGGWRTLNFGKQSITPAADTIYWNHKSTALPNKIGNGPDAESSLSQAGVNSQPSFEVFNGYWADNSGNAISTPIANFISNGSVKVRAYSTVSGTYYFSWDYLSVELATDTSYSASEIQTTVGTSIAGSYPNTFSSEPTTVLYYSVSGTSSGVNSIFKFKNTTSFTGANTLLVDYAGYQSAAGSGYFYVCNFGTPGSQSDCATGTDAKWEQLDSSAVTDTSNAAHHFSKYSATLSSYIRTTGNEIWVKYYTTSLNRWYADYMRVTIGSSNDSTGNSEVAMGKIAASTVSTNTQTLDTTNTAAGSSLYYIVNNTAPAPAIMNTDYGYDCVATPGAAPVLCGNSGVGTTNYHKGSAAVISMPVTQPTNSILTGIRYAGRLASYTANSAVLGIRDWSGTSSVGSISAVSVTQTAQTNTLGGFLDVGMTASTSMKYFNGILTDNPQNKIDNTNNRLQMRARTILATTNPGAVNWDFAFGSIKWFTPSDIIVSGTGTQTTSVSPGSSGNYLGGQFVFKGNIASPSISVTGITLTESGTINAGTNLSNVKLYYDLDTTYPYDCAGEAYVGGGSEAQFGTTQSFNGSNQAAFTGAVTVLPTQAACFYAVLDVGSGASNGDTIKVQISNPSTDVTLSSGTPTPATAVSPSGYTTANIPVWTNINQRGGVIENDENGGNIPDGTVVKIGQRMKIKIQIDTDSGYSQTKVFKLKYSKNGGAFEDVRPAGEIRPALSSVIAGKYALGVPDIGSCPSGTSASVGGRFRGLGTVSGGLKSYSVRGKIYEGRNMTDAMAIPGLDCDEVGFMVDTENAAANATYRFKLVNASDGSNFNNYYAYPSIKTVTADNDTQRFSLSNTANLPTGATSPAIADMVYEADQQGYQNVAADDGQNEILQNVATKMTGIGASADSADMKLTGGVSGDFFGSSAASAGDVNGDGYADTIVGAFQEDSAGDNAGRAYIFYGGPAAGSTNKSANAANVVINGGASSDYFGSSVASAGDVNGDGYSDVMVGAYQAPYSGSAGPGRAYIFYGGQNLVGKSAGGADVILGGVSAGDQFGYSVASSGDVNGDGYSDVIVGSPQEDSGGNNAGRAYIFYGGSSLASETANGANVIITGSAANDRLGLSVSSAGDVNSDGYSDIITGAYAYPGGLGAGRAYIFYGTASMGTSLSANAANVTITNDNNYDNFGFSVASAGDVNGDGYDDVIVGGYGAPYSGAAGPGRAYIFYGGSALTSKTANGANIIITGSTAGDQFGYSVASAGDINGDGYEDVIVGGNSYSGGLGRAYIFYGGSALTSKTANGANIIITGSAGAFGTSVASAGDVNGDGYPDIIAGAYSSGPGRAYIFYGSYQGVGTTNADGAEKIITGEGASDMFGISVASAGDVNGDGYSDIITGAYGYTGGNNNGRAYVFYGGPMANINAGSANVTITGNLASNQFGISVASAGDVNGDGYSDVIVGANGYSLGAAQGSAYIFYGGPTGIGSTGYFSSTSAPVFITGGTASDNFGQSVASAGDVNSDGYSDVIVGAPYAPYSGGNGPGRAYIFYGGSTLASKSANSANVIITGSTAGNYFGYSVASAGDVNGDGYSDVIVGAESYLTSTGRAYIFYGTASMSATIAASSANVIITGPESSSAFGESVASAGDINSDGYADVIIGGHQYVSNTGSAYIFYGGSAGIGATGYFYATSAPVSIIGSTGGGFFGCSVASAGDVNSDGYSDVVVGASNTSYSGGGSGRLYVFYGGSTLGSGFSANSANVIITGGTNNDNFGYSVSGGDINSDGYSDVIGGAYNAASGATRPGRAYIFLGGGNTAYPVFNFSQKAPSACSGLAGITAKWNGQSSVDASTENIFLQVYNFSTQAWETPSGGNNASLAANTDGDISVSLTSNLGNYCDSTSNRTYWRVYQDAGNNILRTDQFFLNPGNKGPAYEFQGANQMQGSITFQ